MRRFPSAGKRGQALTELALALPFIAGLLALTLQGGIVISDQINLEQFAYEGAQWALSHPDQTAATVQDHIYRAMCGGSASPPSGSATTTRYCRQEPSGLSNLVVQVLVSGTPTSAAPAPGPTSAVLAGATGCKAWHLTAALDTNSIGGNTTATYTVTLVVTGSSGPDPIVDLAGGGYPPGLANGSPRFNPPSVSASGGYGTTSSFPISTGASTVPGAYPVLVTGQDQCGSGPSVPATVPVLTILGAGAYTLPAVPAPVAVDLVKDPICANTPTVVTITGTGFQAGATVTLGSGTVSATSVTSSTQILATISAGAGIYDVVVNNPDTSQGVGGSALRILTGTPCPPIPSPSPNRPCAGAPGSYRFAVSITWFEPIALPLFTTRVPPSFTLTANQEAFCQ